MLAIAVVAVAAAAVGTSVGLTVGKTPADSTSSNFLRFFYAMLLDETHRSFCNCSQNSEDSDHKGRIRVCVAQRCEIP